MWTQLLGIIAAIALVWWMLIFVKNNPKAFSMEKLNKSFYTMGVLALILIVIVAVLVFFLRR